MQLLSLILGNLLTFFLTFFSGISSDILSGISSDILSGMSPDILSGISSDILSGVLSGKSSASRLRSGSEH